MHCKRNRVKDIQTKGNAEERGRDTTYVEFIMTEKSGENGPEFNLQQHRLTFSYLSRTSIILLIPFHYNHDNSTRFALIIM